MASTYSTLKVELIGTGDQTGTWGTTTNDNFSIAFGEAITGSADVAFSSADVTVTLTDTNAAQTARNLRLNLTGTSGGARQLILGSGCQIEKLYLVNNGLADAVTVKNTTGTGIAVPAGKSMFVFNNGTNVVDAVTHLTSLTTGSLTLTTPLAVASGGTGSSSTTFVSLTSNVTGVLPVANGGTGSSTAAFSGANITALAANNISTGTLAAARLGTTEAPQFGSLGVGTAASAITGEIRATNNVTAFFSSDERLKDNIQVITNALAKVLQIRGVEFDWNNLTEPEDGYFVRKHDVGVIAQEIEKVLPEVVANREDGIKAVKYDRIIPLLIEAIKELKAEVDVLTSK